MRKAILPVVLAFECSDALNKALLPHMRSAFDGAVKLLCKLDEAYCDISLRVCVLGFSDKVENFSNGFVSVTELPAAKAIDARGVCLVMPLASYLEKSLQSYASIAPDCYVYPPSVIFFCASAAEDKAEYTKAFKDAAQSSVFGVDEDSDALARSNRMLVRVADSSQMDIEQKKRFYSYADALVGGDRELVFATEELSSIGTRLLPLRPSDKRIACANDDVSSFFAEAEELEERVDHCLQISEMLVLDLDGDELCVSMAELTPCMPSEEDIPCFLLRRDDRSGRIALTNLAIEGAKICFNISGRRTLKICDGDEVEYEQDGRIHVLDGMIEVNNDDPFESVKLCKSFNIGETVEVCEWDSVSLHSRKLFEVQSRFDDMF